MGGWERMGVCVSVCVVHVIYHHVCEGDKAAIT